MNVKLARDVINRSTLRLKGKPCNEGNSENYINARNRKVYMMIELHGVGLLAEGQSASRWHFEFFLSVTWGEQLHWHFLHFVEILDFWRRLYFRQKKRHRERNICDTDFFDKSVLFPSLTQNKQISSGFQFYLRETRGKKDDRRLLFSIQKYFILICGRNVS